MAIRINYIFPECYVDTNIMKTLLYLDGVNHQYGCSKVMSGMSSGRFADGFAVGIVDDDKKKTYDYTLEVLIGNTLNSRHNLSPII